MARVLPTSVASVRHLLLAVLAIGLVLRMGAGCEATAATPQAPAAHQSHCADMPAKQGKHADARNCACVACPAMGDPARAPAANAFLVTLKPVAAPLAVMTGLPGGPAPPPPRIA